MPVLLLVSSCSKPIDLEWRRPLGAASVSTPLVTQAFIAVGHDRGMSLVEPNGSARCTFDARGEVIGKPATDGRLVFVGSTNYIFYAVDLTCKEAWKFTTRDRIKSDPLYADGRVYLSSYDGHVYALNAANGELVWAFPRAESTQVEPAPKAPPPEPAAEPAKAKKAKQKAKRKGAGAAAAAAGATATDAAAPAVPGATAAATTAAPSAATDPAPAAPPPALNVGDFSYSSPVLDNGVLYIGNLDGHLYALSAKDGSLLWRFMTNGAVTSSPLVADGVIYFGSNDGNVYALATAGDNGMPRKLWDCATRDWVNSSPRLADGVLYIGSNDRNLYALDAKTGSIKWKFESKGPLIAVPAVYKNLVVAAGGSGDGAIYVLDRDSGQLFWKYETAGKIESDPVVVGDTFYVSGSDQNLYAFAIHATTGK